MPKVEQPPDRGRGSHASVIGGARISDYLARRSPAAAALARWCRQHARGVDQKVSMQVHKPTWQPPPRCRACAATSNIAAPRPLPPWRAWVRRNPRGRWTAARATTFSRSKSYFRAAEHTATVARARRRGEITARRASLARVFAACPRSLLRDVGSVETARVPARRTAPRRHRRCIGRARGEPWRRPTPPRGAMSDWREGSGRGREAIFEATSPRSTRRTRTRASPSIDDDARPHRVHAHRRCRSRRPRRRAPTRTTSTSQDADPSARSHHAAACVARAWPGAAVAFERCSLAHRWSRSLARARRDAERRRDGERAVDDIMPEGGTTRTNIVSAMLPAKRRAYPASGLEATQGAHALAGGPASCE